MMQTKLLSHLRARLYTSLPCMTLHSYQLCVKSDVRDLVVEIDSRWDKIVICCPLFHPASSPELKVFQKDSLSVPPSLVQMQGALNQNAGPKRYLQNHRVFNPMREIHAFSSSADG